MDNLMTRNMDDGCSHISVAAYNDGTRLCKSCGTAVKEKKGYVTLMTYAYENGVICYEFKST